MDNLVVYKGKGAQDELVTSLSRKLGVEVVDKPGDGLTVVVDAGGVSLSGYGLKYKGDFEQMIHRISDGRLQHEMLVHVAKTKDEHPRAIDATAGMGEDSFLLAAYGYDVTLCERNPVVAALLKDAIRRGKKNPKIKDVVGRMHLVEGDSIEYLSNNMDEVDLVYLDPMFPGRQKSGLIGKKLQLIQKLENPCVDEEELLAAAFKAEPKRIIVKRPLKGQPLAGKEPNYSVKGKAIRYDGFYVSK